MTVVSNATDRASLAVSLLDRLEEVTGEHEDQLAMLTNLRRGLAIDIADPSDGGVKSIDIENGKLVAHCLHQRRDQLAQALTRLRDGTYGTCAICSQTIPAERLLASPAATLCMKCQRVAELHPQ